MPTVGLESPMEREGECDGRERHARPASCRALQVGLLKSAPDRLLEQPAARGEMKIATRHSAPPDRATSRRQLRVNVGELRSFLRTGARLNHQLEQRARGWQCPVGALGDPTFAVMKRDKTLRGRLRLNP